MAGRYGLWAIALLVLTFGAAERVAAEVREALNRPGIFEVGEPMLISREGLRREMNRNSALREYIDAYGWPDYSEVQNMVIQEPLAPYEVRIYYLQQNQEHAFVRVNVAPTYQNFGIRKYQGSIPPQTIDRLLTVRAAMEAPPPAPEPAPELAAVAEPVEAPVVKQKIVLRGVNFDLDKSQIRADAQPVLDEAVDTLKAESAIKILAEGYTDSTASEAYNQALSERRATAVKEYLVAGGIAAGRIQTEGFGESRPVASNDTADGRAQNRRVELRVIAE